MSTLFLSHFFILILIEIFGVWLMLWVFIINKKSKVNQNFALMTFFILLWILFGYLSRAQMQPFLSVFFYKLNLAAVCFMFIFDYFFSVYFPKEGKRYPLLDKFVLVLNIPLALITIFTNLIIKDIKIEGEEISFILGKGSFVFYGMVYLLTFLILFVIAKKYSTLSKNNKLKVQYFIVGGFLFAIINLIVNVTLPFFQGNFKYYWVGDYSMIIWLGFTAYAIVKRQLFGIKVVLTQLLVGVIAILLLINFLISKSLFEYAWKGALLATFLLAGWMLVGSVMKEVRQKEQLDQMASDLATTNVRLEAALQELRKLDQAKTDFMNIVSHQLRTPLTIIKGITSMALEGSFGTVSGEMKRYLRQVFNSTERLVRLVNSFLGVTRLETGKVVLEIKEFSLSTLAEKVVEEFKVEASEKGLGFYLVKRLQQNPVT